MTDEQERRQWKEDTFLEHYGTTGPWWRKRWEEQRRVEREEPDRWTAMMWARIYRAVYGDGDTWE